MTFNPDELRLIGMSAHIWIKMLKSKETKIIDRMYGEYRNGKTDHITALAELSAVRDMIHEITTALKLNEKQE